MLPTLFPSVAPDAPTPARRSQIGIRIAAFLVSLLLVFTGILHGVMAVMAYVGGDIVGAVGKGAEDASAASSADHSAPDSLAAAAGPDLDGVAATAKSWALRAKLIGLGFGVITAALLLAGELIRRRVRTIAAPIAFGVGIAGELAMAIVLSPSTLLGMGGAACLLGMAVWWRIPRDQAEPMFS